VVVVDTMTLTLMRLDGKSSRKHEATADCPPVRQVFRHVRRMWGRGR